MQNREKESLLQVLDFVNEMKATSSTNEKKKILAKHESPFLKELLHYVYHPFKKFNVTSKNLKKKIDLVKDDVDKDNLFHLLDLLVEGRLRGHEALSEVNGYIQRYNESPDIQELIYDVFDRNIKIRVDDSIINTVFPNTIPVFKVALAEKFEGHYKKVNLLLQDWYASRKLDGVRCATVIGKEIGDIKFLSRAGKEFETLGVIKELLIEAGLTDVVLDGEMCVLREDGSEDFQGILKQIKKKNYTIENPVYYLFDILTHDEFNSGTSARTLTQRLDVLNRLKDKLPSNFKILDQVLVKSMDEIETMKNEAIARGEEGIMIRKDSVYIGDRSDEILKIKAFFDDEFTVVDAQNSTQRVIIDGQEVEEVMLSNIVIALPEGGTVDVGSGFSMNQRRHYYLHPEEIVGKRVTVKYFEKTKNQNGEPSLRFPVFKAVYEGERDV